MSSRSVFAPVRRMSAALAVALLLSQGAGCAVFDATAEIGRQTASLFKPRERDYRDGTQEVTEAWVEEAGRDARGSRPVEKDPDEWWGKYFMSPKARSIERNMGIGWEE